MYKKIKMGTIKRCTWKQCKLGKFRGTRANTSAKIMKEFSFIPLNYWADGTVFQWRGFLYYKDFRQMYQITRNYNR